MDFPIGSDYRVTSLCLRGNNDSSVFVGDSGGEIGEWDLRVGKRIASLKSSLGSVRCMQIDEEAETLASVSLDRFLHVYRIGKSRKTHDLIDRVYLKNRLLSCCLVASPQRQSLLPSVKEKDNETEEDLDEEQMGEQEDLLQNYLSSSEDEEEPQVITTSSSFSRGERSSGTKRQRRR